MVVGCVYVFVCLHFVCVCCVCVCMLCVHVSMFVSVSVFRFMDVFVFVSVCHCAGINCERCEDFFFRPLDRSQAHLNACVPCHCHMEGVVTNPETGLLGDCVMNSDTTLPLGMVQLYIYCNPNMSLDTGC